MGSREKARTIIFQSRPRFVRPPSSVVVLRLCQGKMFPKRSVAAFLVFSLCLLALGVAVPVEDGTTKADSDDESQVKYDYCDNSGYADCDAWTEYCDLSDNECRGYCSLNSDCDSDEYCDWDGKCKYLYDWWYYNAVWFWVVFSITTIIGIISGVCVCCFCCSCCIVAAKRKNRTQQGRVLYTTPTAYQQGAVYANQTSPYAAPSTASNNIYSTPYGHTQQTNSQFGSPPAYDNSGYSSYTNPDSSAVNQKY